MDKHSKIQIGVIREEVLRLKNKRSDAIAAFNEQKAAFDQMIEERENRVLELIAGEI